MFRFVFTIVTIFAALNVAFTQQSVALAYPMDKAETFQELIVELNTHAVNYEQKYRRAYMLNHPLQYPVTGFHPNEYELDLKLYDFFRDRGYYLNMSSKKYTQYFVQKTDPRLVNFNNFPPLLSEIAGRTQDTVHLLKKYYNSKSPTTATNIKVTEIGEPVFVVMDKRFFSDTSSVLYEEFIEAYLYANYGKNLQLFKGIELLDLGITHPTRGRNQVSNFIGGVSNMEVNGSESNVLNYLNHGFSFVVRSTFNSAQQPTAQDEYLILANSVFKNAMRVDETINKGRVISIARSQLGIAGSGTVDPSKVSKELTKDWSPQDFALLVSYCIEDRDDVLDMIYSGKTAKTNYLPYLIIIAIVLSLLIIYLRRRK